MCFWGAGTDFGNLSDSVREARAWEQVRVLREDMAPSWAPAGERCPPQGQTGAVPQLQPV